MEKLVKFWWIGAVATLGAVAFLFARQEPPQAVPATPEAIVENSTPPDEAPTEAPEDSEIAATNTSKPESDVSTPVETTEPDLTAPDSPETAASDALESAANALPPDEASADEEAVATSETSESEPDLSITTLVPNAAPTEEQPSNTPPLNEALQARPLDTQEAAQGVDFAEQAPTSAVTETTEVAPDVSTGLDAALQAPIIEENAGQTLQPDAAVEIASTPKSGPAPDPVLPAPTLGDEDPTLGLAPDFANQSSGAPEQETAPLLGESSPPLTLAQVLPPGEAPSPDQIAPSFDLVRVAPDGSAVIAGRAAPGANVQVFSGNIPIAEVITSARGEFVVFLDAPGAPTLDLQIPTAPEGAQLVVSQDDIIILPAAPDAEDSAPLVLRRTPDAVQIVQPSGPAIPSNISLDLVSYTDTGAVQLAGRGRPGNIARIYTDNTLVGEAPIASGGNWKLEISDIAEGRYVLRVDEIAPDGRVRSRTESPFQRQFPEANLPETFSQGAKIIVQPGNTLWLMATEAYGNGDAFTQIFSANSDSIRDPDLIYPGQIFSIPRIDE